ncbi:MAG: peptidase [Actinomycetota bacterium]|nr:peptidase [Actinomycetota bacterium]
MTRTSLLAAAVAALTAAALAVSPNAGAALFADGTPRADTVRVKAAATTAAEHHRIVEYWTPARMRNAVPADRIVADRPRTSAGGAVERGEPVVVGARAKTGKPGASADGTGGYYTGGGEVAETTGKVFFTLGGTDYVCSGSATTSTNRDVVLTAGHCVNEGPGDYATKWAFVPGYDDGARPFGTFTARQLVTTSQWAGSGDFDYDVGLAVMNTLGGEHLTDVVGSQGIAFNQPRGQLTYAFGYPAARPYDGTDIAYCHDTVFADTYGGSQDQGMDCNMTGGSSGGPWLIGYSASAGVGTLNSVNSFGYRGLKDVMWGPYFGAVAQQAYATAAGM